tara:strand:- start:788 stop:1297 length:510 start_codon:yes stop_codon:yes gene_type:complete
VKLVGCHRKHAIRLLAERASERAPRARQRVYDESVKQALIVLWEASDRLCSKRLRYALLESLERHGHLSTSRVVRARLLSSPRGDGAGSSSRPAPGVPLRIEVTIARQWHLHPCPTVQRIDWLGDAGQHRAVVSTSTATTVGAVPASESVCGCGPRNTVYPWKKKFVVF